MRFFLRRLPRLLGWALLLYLLYALVTGIFSYWKPVHAQQAIPPEALTSRETGPDRALLVEAPQDAFSRRVEVIRAAQRTLDVTYHCVKTGETTDCFFAELVKAADRGVQVRVLLDGAVGGFTGEHKHLDLALLAHPNIQYRAYNPIRLLKPWQWNVRLHDKFILADDAMLMLGGRNIGDEYFDPPAYEGRVTHDRDVVVLNTAAGSVNNRSVTGQVRAYMDLLWSAPETDVPRPLTGRKLETGQAELDRLRQLSAQWEADWPDYYLPAVPAEELAVETRQITLLRNPLGTFKKEPTLGADLTRLLQNCTSIRIQTPYATASRGTLAALSHIARDAQVDFLTNSRASTPNLPAFSAYYSRRQKFLDTGVTLHEYQSTDSIHGKSCVADSHLSVVGSYNLDDRSIYIDTESVLVLDSPAFYEVLNGCLDHLFAQSAQVGPDNAYLPDQTVEVVEPSMAKRALISVVSVFSRLFQPLI